jgi:hypothetical protein
MRATRAIQILAAAAFGLAIATPAPAHHRPGHNPPGQTGFSDPRHEGPGKGLGHNTENRGNSGHPAAGHIPELDPGMAGSAALLLIGGTLVLAGRRRLEPQS